MNFISYLEDGKTFRPKCVTTDLYALLVRSIVYIIHIIYSCFTEIGGHTIHLYMYTRIRIWSNPKEFFRCVCAKNCQTISHVNYNFLFENVCHYIRPYMMLYYNGHKFFFFYFSYFSSRAHFMFTVFWHDPLLVWTDLTYIHDTWNVRTVSILPWYKIFIHFHMFTVKLAPFQMPLLKINK